MDELHFATKTVLSMSTELKLPPIIRNKKRWKIEWTLSMIQKLKEKFPTSYNKELAKELGVSWRSLVRKARELGVDKEPGFLDIHRQEITAMAVKANHNPNTGNKGWSVPGSEKHQYRKGHVPAMKIDRKVIEKVRDKRNETIKRERFRVQYGLPQRTRLKLLP